MTAQTFELNHCYNMDCMEAMAAFPNDYFDLAVVDPPYFSGPERRGFYGSKVSRIGVQGNHLDVAVSGSHEDALNWDGYGEHQVWIIKEAG